MVVKAKFACGPYDRIEPLRTGEVTIPGLDLEVISIQSPRELFDRMNNEDEFQIAEMSASEFISGHSRGDRKYIAIPVFPSKVFRHGFITVNVNAGIKEPRDLACRRIGVPLYSQTAAIWIRGILQGEYGADLTGVTWVQGAVERPGVHGDPHPPKLLSPVRIEVNDTKRSLDQLLKSGEIDALIGARLPPSLETDDQVVRLFPDFRERERDYYKRTGIHPIMHLVVIRREIYEQHKWLASALYEGLEKAKNTAWRNLCFSGAQKSMLPWAYADIAEARETFGPDPWPYGIPANRAALETLVDYMYRQAFISARPRVEDLFK